MRETAVGENVYIALVLLPPARNDGGRTDPPRANMAYAFAISRGVTVIGPCPIPSETAEN